VLITDNCAVDTALGQDRKNTEPKGRLLFAPVTEASQEDIDPASFGRFGMPGWEGHLPAGIAELRRCFMVDARDVAAHKGDRVASLGAAAAEDLELRWNAYAARRGPLASTRNAEKLAALLARARGNGDLLDPEKDLTRSVAQAMATAWRAEAALEAAAAAYDAGEDGDREIEALITVLRDVSADTLAAAEGFSSARPDGA
jgi:hypothetical protein